MVRGLHHDRVRDIVRPQHEAYGNKCPFLLGLTSCRVHTGQEKKRGKGGRKERMGKGRKEEGKWEEKNGGEGGKVRKGRGER